MDCVTDANPGLSPGSTDAEQNAPAEPFQSYPRPSSPPRLLNPEADILTTAGWVNFGCQFTRLVGQNCMLKHSLIDYREMQ
jgi:hypothetical protein